MRRAALLSMGTIAFFAGWQPGWAQDDTRTVEAAEETVDTASQEAAVDADEPGSAWWIDVFGYVRVALELVQNDPNYDFVGENNGFVLNNARLGVAGGHERSRFSWRISVDGAADTRENLNIPAGDLRVRLRDVYLREDPYPWLGIQIGQFKAPFSAEELRSTSDLRFVSRSVGLEGVRVGRGFEQPGIVIDRQLGAMLSPDGPFLFPCGFGFWYGLMLANGNGANEILNDNNEFAVFGRLELYWQNLVRLGGAVLSNSRTEGELPNRFDENDFGWTADLLVTWAGLEVYGQITHLQTEFPTTGSPTQEQLAWHAQVLYLFDFEALPVPFGPEYRIAYFDPRAEGGTDDAGVSLEQFRLLYHTIGLYARARDFPVTTVVNYTFTTEEAPRELENNRLEVLAQIEW